jgi:L-arabinose isomerase
MLDGIKFVPSAIKNRMIFTNKGISVSPLVNGRGIMFVLDKSDAVHVSVFDTRGRTVLSVNDKRFSAGSHALLLPVASGVYTVRVKCGTDSRSIPLTCIR